MQDKYRGEQILVFKRDLLDELGFFQGVSTKVDHYLGPILKKENNNFHLRHLAEEDPSLQQIIPYIMFTCGDEVFSYVRGKKAGETRLVGNRSVGIGGHINPVDQSSSDLDTYLAAVHREINEEVLVEGEYTPKITALIKDESNPVGEVHFGVVHICDLPTKSVSKREQQITQSGFSPIEDLAGPRREELESWSALCIDLLMAQKK